MTSVYIVGHDGDPSNLYHRMFVSQGWDVVPSLKKADLVQFTGGLDISPALYKSGKHPKTHVTRQRDIFETCIFNTCQKGAIPMAGICRGAQLINVLTGGSLWQDVDNHIVPGGHVVDDLFEHFSFKAPSLHHQMMRPGKDAHILATASQSTKREGALSSGQVTTWESGAVPFRDDPEVLLYFDPLALCFQPHPEKDTSGEATDIYFYYLQEYLGLKTKEKK